MKKLLLIMLSAALYGSCVKETNSPSAQSKDMATDNAVKADTPIVNFTSPKNGDIVAGTTTINVVVTDNVGIDSVQCTVDGKSLGTKTATPYNFSWTTTDMLNGTHLLKATAYDHSGRSASAKITVNINNTAILPIEQKLINLINKERKKQGLTPYKFNPLLFKVARDHSLDMAIKNFFSEFGSDGSTLETQVTRTSYAYTDVAENIAGGQKTALILFNHWMGDPGESSVLLSPTFKDIGVGGGYSSAKNSVFHYYWTLVAATPK